MFPRVIKLALLAWLAVSFVWSPASAESDADAFVLWMPYVSQLTDSPYASSNCGPASLTMVLNAYGIFVTLDEVREEANALQGTDSPDAGVSIEYLATIVQQHGLVAVGPYEGSDFKRWTAEEVREQLRQGNAFIPQLHLASLSGHEDKDPYVDHYIVIYGLLGGGFVYADSAFPASTLEGGYRFISEERLLEAWQNSQFPLVGFAVAPGEGYHSLLPTPTRTPTLTPSPTPTPRPTRTPTPSPSATLPAPTEAPSATLTPTPTEVSTPEQADSGGSDLLTTLITWPASTGAALGWILK